MGEENEENTPDEAVQKTDSEDESSDEESEETPEGE